jgi:hypothetical protein
MKDSRTEQSVGKSTIGRFIFCALCSAMIIYSSVHTAEAEDCKAYCGEGEVATPCQPITSSSCGKAYCIKTVVQPGGKVIKTATEVSCRKPSPTPNPTTTPAPLSCQKTCNCGPEAEGFIALPCSSWACSSCLCARFYSGAWQFSFEQCIHPVKSTSTQSLIDNNGDDFQEQL